TVIQVLVSICTRFFCTRASWPGKAGSSSPPNRAVIVSEVARLEEGSSMDFCFEPDDELLAELGDVEIEFEPEPPNEDLSPETLSDLPPPGTLARKRLYFARWLLFAGRITDDCAWPERVEKEEEESAKGATP